MLLWSLYSVVTLKLWFEKSQSLTTISFNEILNEDMLYNISMDWLG